MIFRPVRHEKFSPVLLILLCLLLIPLYLVPLATHPLLEPDEGRYAEIPREMNESGDYITPRLNYVSYFEKPALLYWMNALSFKLLGETAFAARLFCALSALAGVVATGLLGNLIYGRRAGLLAAVVTGTSLLYFAIGTLNLTDMPLSLFLTLSLAAFYAGYRTRHHRWYLLFYAAMALGLLTKGLVAIVLPGGVVFCFAVFTKKLRPITDALYVPGMLLFFAIALPWFWLVCRENPDFFRFFFIQEHFMRYATKMHGRYEPIWYFLPILFAGVMPWSGFLPSLLRKGGLLRSPGSPEVAEANLFCGLWFGVILLFFSASSSKLIPYVVPCIPPLALLVSADVERAAESGSRSGFVVSAVLNALFACALFWYAFYGKLERAEALPVAVAIAVPLLIGAALSMWCLLRGRSAGRALVVLSVCALLFIAGAQTLYPILAQTRSVGHVAAAAIQNKAGDERIAVYGEVLQAVPFYAKERVILIDYLGELAYGASQLGEEERAAWFPNTEEFLTDWEAGEPLMLVVEKKRLGNLFGGAPVTAVNEIDCGDYMIFFNTLGPRP